MITVDCPYCDEEINILFGEEIDNLLRRGRSDCICDYCRRVFEIYYGKEKIETRSILKGCNSVLGDYDLCDNCARDLWHFMCNENESEG